MKDNCILTAESVTEGHPHKLCDTIADAVVDACLKLYPTARVACEVMAPQLPDIPAIICKTVQRAGYGGSDYEVEVIMSRVPTSQGLSRASRIPVRAIRALCMAMPAMKHRSFCPSLSCLPTA